MKNNNMIQLDKARIFTQDEFLNQSQLHPAFINETSRLQDPARIGRENVEEFMEEINKNDLNDELKHNLLYRKIDNLEN